MWAIAQTAWFVANDRLSQAVTFPIISMVPGVCAALWSVFYFHEIEGSQNLRILTTAISITMLGAVLVGVSKSI
ncbi:Transmembrane protein -like protein [Toxocara canis]|uniref:Transmembrane protein-like protein n=1 Tax=Toxocara canis TaxID=6265 RepID=A0A0B2V4K4_TOXCA|nr:Transmembrane protein -like protein [Toxocara canis]